MNDSENILMKITEIINEPGITWKVRQALLRSLDIQESLIFQLVPEPSDGLDHHPSDY